MRRTWILPSLALVALLCVSAPAEEFDEDYVHGQIHRPSDKPGGQACWPYLRNPLRPTADPVCERCEKGGNCSTLNRPRGTSGMCWGSQDIECFWKRHCFSWGIRCSQCWEDEECDLCDELIGGRDERTRQMLQQQLQIEGHSKKHPLWIAVSPHFYVVTDIHRKLKVPTEGGAPRLATGHEVAHLFAQRCELAYNDFVHYFGGGVLLGKPMAVYLYARNRDMQATAARYLGSANTDMLYGGGSNRIAGGFAGNGFVGSLQEQRNDLGLHGLCRHMIGHILFSCWLKGDPSEKVCPKWAFIGCAHFLEKLIDRTVDYGTFCSNETTAPSGSTKDWHKKARALASRRLDPIETFFGRESMGSFSYTDHIRAWSIMDLMLKEDREPWLAVLREIRMGAHEGAAFKAGLGITPDAFNERWKDRLTGKRRTMGPVRADAGEGEEEPGTRERRRIRQTDDEDVLAGLIRGLDRISDVKTAKVVVERLDHESDLVRETVFVVLMRTQNPEVMSYLHGEALENTDPLVRAGVTRVLGALKYAPAREDLEFLLEDRHWLVRAEAAWAVGQIGHPDSLSLLMRGLEDPNEKSWIVHADAVASYGKPSKRATLAIAPRLSNRHWQVRVTAARALARIGTEEAIDPLIKRFAREGGRLYRELRRALKSVTQDDLGPNPETWRKWWEKQQERHGGLGPMPEKRAEPDDRYGDMDRPHPDDPAYYGRRIYSKSVGFVLDTSGSMNKTMVLPAEDVERLRAPGQRGSRFDLAKSVLIDALEKLDPRVRFELVFFSSDVRPWKKRLVPATPGNVKAASSAVRAQPSAGETNIHGALKAAIGLHDRDSLEASLDPIPDTVYFLTDGSPTRGQITDADTLLAWFEFLNRYAKVELHVIAMGNLGVDLGFLQRLAKVGGGEFIHVREQ
jgi:HEAT repeat protein